MKIKFVHRRPRCPMRMRHLLSAFIKVPAPELAGNISQFPRKRLKNAERDKELQGPNRRFGHLFLNDSRKRTAHLNLPTHFPRQLREFLETIRRPLRIDDVRAKKSAATI